VTKGNPFAMRESMNKQVVFGFIAVAITFGVGRLIGVVIQ
jgi:VIT1/CCC1 family predicted Fe2+/Mn2+ transporter